MAGDIIKFQRASVWIDGQSLAGEIGAIEMPSMTWDTDDHKPLSGLGTQQYPTRMGPLEAKLSWESYSLSLAALSADPYTTVNLQLRVAYGVYRGSNLVSTSAGITVLSGRFTSSPLGNFNGDDGTEERESMMAVDYVKETFQGVTLREFSANPAIWVVNGVDKLRASRLIVGA